MLSDGDPDYNGNERHSGIRPRLRLERPILGVGLKSAANTDCKLGSAFRMSCTVERAATRPGTIGAAAALLCILLLKPLAVLGQDDPNVYCTGDPCEIAADIEVEDGTDVDFNGRVVVLSGILSVRDGEMTIRAGELQIVGQGQLNASRGDGGGSFEILTTGDVRIDGERDSGAIRLVGEDGGILTISSDDGSIFGAGDIIVNSTVSLGDGGCIDLSAGGDINLTGAIEAVSGLEAAGGELDAFAEGDVSITGSIDLTGGEDGGGPVFIDAIGSVILGPIMLDGRGEFGDAGEIDVSAEDSIELRDSIRARGSNGSVELCGDGGDGSFEAGEDLNILAEIDVDARRGDCLAGSLDFTGRTVSIGGPIGIRGEGVVDGSAGSLRVTATERIVCTADVDGRGNGDGGIVQFSLDAPTPSMNDSSIECAMDLSGPRARFEMEANTNVTVRGTILVGTSTSSITRGGIPTGGPITSGGLISIEGCTVDITRNATLTSQGMGAVNRITAREDLLVAGDLTAGESNELRFRPGFAPSITGLVVPAANLTPDGSLESCGFPTRTPTITPTATLTPTPTVTPTPPPPCVGDCNRDGAVTVDELVLGLDIGLGTDPVEECPPADANHDGSVDVSEVVTAVSNSLNECSTLL